MPIPCVGKGLQSLIGDLRPSFQVGYPRSSRISVVGLEAQALVSRRPLSEACSAIRRTRRAASASRRARITASPTPRRLHRLHVHVEDDGLRAELDPVGMCAVPGEERDVGWRGLADLEVCHAQTSTALTCPATIRHPSGRLHQTRV